MSRVIAALEQLGIERSAIRTESITLSPRYRRGPEVEEPTIAGYEAGNRVSVRVDRIDEVGRVVDAAIEAGANRVDGIRFELAEPEAVYREALRDAVARARREAEAIADAMDETLGPAIRVSTDGIRIPVPERPMAFARMEAAPTPVEPGDLEVTASVHITYRLEP